MESLKERLRAFYLEQEADFDPEATKNVLETLDGFKDDLSNCDKWGFVELLNLMDNDNDPELYKELQDLEDDYLEKLNDDDIFA